MLLMKHLLFYTLLSLLITSCQWIDSNPPNESAIHEQAHTEQNQQALLRNQPPPDISWSLERENLINRFKLMNDRDVMFYMYVFNMGVDQPIGYYQVNKVSSVNSQLTNTMQIISGHRTSNDLPNQAAVAIPSPAEDGSYGTNGDGVFGFTPEQIYIEHNMPYILSTVPLSFPKPVNHLTVINVESERQLKLLLDKMNK